MEGVPAGAQCRFSEAAAEEARGYVARLAASAAGRIDGLAVDAAAVPTFADEVRASAARMHTGPRWLVYAPVPGLRRLKEQGVLAWTIGNILGDPIRQNEQGWRIAEVYNRASGRIEDGARYHQTRQGAYIHNDQTRPYTPDRTADDPGLFDYLVFSCGAAACLGGETILVDAFAVHAELRRFPEALAVLQTPFWFENRGETGGLFQMPILSFTESGEPEFRYFKAYIEGAHGKAGEPLTAPQAAALDVLETILEQSRVQCRLRLQSGETLVTVDSQVMHSRTQFVDRAPPRPVDVETETLDSVNRFFFRIWSRRRA
ncbi:MAG TPA: TauD/TfdA family dioxygenase [Methylomirabilota bacterium]|nr:TauD/TfdA family dioxygenase [Methylomirabilota bacterium]